MTCWQKLGIQWNGLLNIYDKVLEAERQSSHPFFMEIVMIALWEIWNLRNFKFFDGGAPSIRLWVRKFRDQGYLQLVRVREDQCAAFILFLETISFG
jgi:hypothetical protein